MSNEIAQLTDEQQQQINQLEAQIGKVLIAYEGYQKEDAQGRPLES